MLLCRSRSKTGNNTKRQRQKKERQSVWSFHFLSNTFAFRSVRSLYLPYKDLKKEGYKWPKRTLGNFADIFQVTILYCSYFRCKMINKPQRTFILQRHVWSITTSQHSISKYYNLYFTAGEKAVLKISDLPGSTAEPGCNSSKFVC